MSPMFEPVPRRRWAAVACAFLFATVPGSGTAAGAERVEVRLDTADIEALVLYQGRGDKLHVVEARLTVDAVKRLEVAVRRAPERSVEVMFRGKRLLTLRNLSARATNQLTMTVSASKVELLSYMREIVALDERISIIACD